MELEESWPLAERFHVRDELLAAYGDPQRGYHDTRHLREVLERLEELEAEGFERRPVLLAAWFHDGVYDGRPEPEERSARWAEQALAGLPDAAEVARLVRMTEHHRPAAGDTNAEALSDADLAILAAPVDRYTEYTEQVRREYAHVADADFRAGREAILRDLLAKPTLFHTATARARWERPGRANVERELEGLH